MRRCVHTQSTSVAQSSGTVGSTAPFGRLGTVTAMATARWSSPAPSLLCIRSRKTSASIQFVHVRMRLVLWLAGNRRLVVLLIIVPLFSQCLLLFENHVFDGHHSLEYTTLMPDNIVAFIHCRQRAWYGSRSLSLMSSSAVMLGESHGAAATLSNLEKTLVQTYLLHDHDTYFIEGHLKIKNVEVPLHTFPINRLFWWTVFGYGLTHFLCPF